MNNNRFLNTYNNWLRDYVAAEWKNETHDLLLDTLFSQEYKEKYPIYDENRVMDIKELQSIFLEDYEEMRDDDNISVRVARAVLENRQVSLLEVLIIFADKLSNLTYGDARSELNLQDSFWLILTNMGLDVYSDLDYNHNDVVEILYKFVNMEYKTSEKGSPFPLKGGENNQLSDGLLMLLNQYTIENMQK